MLDISQRHCIKIQCSFCSCFFLFFSFFLLFFCKLLRLNSRAWGEHLTSQLSWVASSCLTISHTFYLPYLRRTCFKWIVFYTFKWLNGQQSRLPFRRSVIISRESRLFNFDIVNLLWKSNGGRGRRGNFVFSVIESVLFVSGWVAMAWSKVLFRASWKFT